jgi:outer membrane receptor for ferrienterochelin and colicin
MNLQAGGVGQQTTTSNTKQPIEEVVVSGVRESLRKALDVKREANSIVDAISSEDIGVFPDENVAESLQRVSGVALSRERGEGSRISIRGPVKTPFNRTDTETKTLPSANLILNVTDNLIVRQAGARTPARPTFGELSPALLVVQELRTAQSGNPGLDPFIADQADLSTELYFGTASTVSAAAFYKDVKSFTLNSTTAETLTVNGETAIYQVTRPRNGGGGEIFGFELAYLQNFTFLPQPFDGLGVSLNYTYSDSNTQNRDPMTGGDLPLPGQSKDTVNATLFYEKGPLSMGVAFNYRSKFFNSFSNGNTVFIDQISQRREFDLSDQQALVGVLRRHQHHGQGHGERIRRR